MASIFVQRVAYNLQVTKTVTVNESTISISNIYIVERQVPFPLIFQAHNVFMVACVLISIGDAIR